MNYKKIIFTIFLCSCASLAYEVDLIRIFSISLWYHFAFMVISIAMLGIGASGTVMSLFSKLRNISNISTYCLLLGVGISLSYLISNQIPFDPVKLSWSKIQLIYIGCYYVILSVPFFFTGLIVAIAFSELSGTAGLFYAADLLGAGIGSAGVLYLLSVLSPEKSIFAISLLALCAAFISGGNKIKASSSIFMLLIIYLFIFQPEITNLRMSPYKGLQIAMRYPSSKHIKTYFSPFSRIDTLKSPVVRFAPGLSLNYLDALPEQIGFSVDGGEINAITASGNMKSLAFLRYLPSSLPYEITNQTNFSRTPSRKEEENVLILDPKGGIQYLIAKYYGFSKIYSIESNPLLVKVIKSDYNEFSGGVYKQNSWEGLGRSWLKYANRNFDIIDISMLGSIPSGLFGISEDYRFTVEAFKEYLSHLNPEGIISINLFILPPPRIELRILNTAITSIGELMTGDEDIEKHIVAIRSLETICILIKKSPFTLYEIVSIRNFTKNRKFDLIYYPGITEKETNVNIRMPLNEYFILFKNLLKPETREQFINMYAFNIKPVRDENPFFHYYLKLKNIKAIYMMMGEKWQYFIQEGYILPVVFIQVLLLSLILVFLPAFSSAYPSTLTGKGLLPYFAFLGLGFMFVEVSFVQKMILVLENPSYAVATVLTSILVSSGIGSLLSYKIMWLRNAAITLIITFFIILYSIFLPSLSDVISQNPLYIKILFIFIALMPLGLLMGMPFPVGLKVLGEKNDKLISWAWAINGCFSVLAPVLTIMLALVVGFKVVLWLAALTYGMAFVNLRGFLKK
jgi:hypothetical protein